MGTWDAFRRGTCCRVSTREAGAGPGRGCARGRRRTTPATGKAIRPASSTDRARQCRFGQGAVVAFRVAACVGGPGDLQYPACALLSVYRVIQRHRRRQGMRAQRRQYLVCVFLHPAVQGPHVPARIRQARPQRIDERERASPGRRLHTSGLAGDRRLTPHRARRRPGRGGGDAHVHRLRKCWATGAIGLWCPRRGVVRLRSRWGRWV